MPNNNLKNEYAHDIYTMIKFCKFCDNIATPTFYNDELMFKCHVCQLTYPPNDEDTLRYESVKESNVMIFEKILNNAANDPTALKAYKKCINKGCKGNVVKQTVIGSDMHLYNSCTVCKTQWLN